MGFHNFTRNKMCDANVDQGSDPELWGNRTGPAASSLEHKDKDCGHFDYTFGIYKSVR